jgi:hypothetical protein
MVRSRQAPPTVVSRQLKVRIEVDLRVIATCDSQEEEDKNLKFSPEVPVEFGVKKEKSMMIKLK